MSMDDNDDFSYEIEDDAIEAEKPEIEIEDDTP